MKKIFRSTSNTRAIIPDSYRYIRSDVPTDVTEEEIDWLLEQNVTTIVDLREESERIRKVCPLESDQSFRYFCLPVSGDNKIPESSDKVAVSYINMVDSQMDHIIEIIINAQSNVLYFCNAGKDRTGVVSAILLRNMGMSDDYIVEDYMKSKDNLTEMIARFAEEHPEIDAEIITPHSAYMEEFLKLLD